MRLLKPSRMKTSCEAMNVIVSDDESDSSPPQQRRSLLLACLLEILQKLGLYAVIPEVEINFQLRYILFPLQICPLLLFIPTGFQSFSDRMRV